MVLGIIQGKITTSEFSFEVKEECKNFEYVQVFHKVYDFVLCQIIEITRHNNKTIANCQIIGYPDKGKIKRPRIPFDPDTEVLLAQDEFISNVINIPNKESSAIIGQLEGRSIPVPVDLNKLLTKHVAVLAKSGAGKSYAVGVLLEEIAEKGVPVLVIDPHGEYGSLAKPNTDQAELQRMARFNIEPKGYPVAVYGDPDLVSGVKPLRMNARWSATELAHLLPGKLSANQQAVLYSALKNLREVTFDSLLTELELDESPAKYGIISSIEYLRSLPFFSSAPTPYSELIKPAHISIINFKGIAPDVQEIMVYKLCKDLFALRKQNKISPFFLVVEEAHNYCPERSFGEAKSSKILRDLASEGRKFGLGLCVVSQRPARVDKSVLSQCSTQIILKVTNPNDLKSLSASVEGLTAESEREIKNLPIGTALLTGLSEVPLFVTIRTRKSHHGGQAVNILNNNPQDTSMLEHIEHFSNEELLPLIKPTISAKDLEIMSDEELVGVQTILVPAYQFLCREGEDQYKLLVEMQTGAIVTDKDSYELKHLPSLHKLSTSQRKILHAIFTTSPTSLEALQEKTPSTFSLHEDLEVLEEQSYLQKNADDTYTINPNYVFTKLSKLASYDEPQYESIPYHHKHPSILDLDAVREHLNTFTTVIDQYECFLVRHETLPKRDDL